MNLRGQPSRGAGRQAGFAILPASRATRDRRRDGLARDEAGYAMAALLVGLSIMSIMMTVALPVWRTSAQREKEAELIFRGEQYMRAIELFGRRAGPGVLPPTIDALVDGRFLRKKYTDPITGEEFQLLVAGQSVPGAAAPGGTVPPPGAPAEGRGRGPFVTRLQQTGRGGAITAGPMGASPGAAARGGIQGVVSKSRAKSLRLYNGRNYYNEWAFVHTPRVQAPGPGGPGGRGGAPGRGRSTQPGRGGRGLTPPDGRGSNPFTPFGRGTRQEQPFAVPRPLPPPTPAR